MRSFVGKSLKKLDDLFAAKALVSNICKLLWSIRNLIYESKAMTNQTQKIEDIFDRLVQLERQNRRIKKVGVILLLIFGALIGMAQVSPKARIIEAEKISFVTQEGVRIGTFGVSRLKTGLEFCDPDGKPRVSLWIGAMAMGNGFSPSKHTGLYINDGDDRNSISLVAGSQLGVNLVRFGQMEPVVSLGTTDEGATLLLRDANNRQRILLDVNAKSSGLTILDKNEKALAAMRDGLDSRGVVLWDKNQRPRVILNYTEPNDKLAESNLTFWGDKGENSALRLSSNNQSSAIALSDSHGTQRAIMIHIVEKGSMFIITDADGKPLWGAP